MATIRYTVVAIRPVPNTLLVPDPDSITSEEFILFATPWGVPSSKQELDYVGEVATRARKFYTDVRVYENRYRQPAARKLIAR